ncbi:MAG: hypothetical protein HQL46_06565 [Gammaproteobacteria bacterium]|nr:hypothetical protein [Gammaproteobacteria bacterium]
MTILLLSIVLKPKLAKHVLMLCFLSIVSSWVAANTVIDTKLLELNTVENKIYLGKGYLSYFQESDRKIDVYAAKAALK